jgi:hypothetical protein
LRGWPVAAGEMLAEQIQMTVLSVVRLSAEKRLHEEPKLTLRPADYESTNLTNW